MDYLNDNKFMKFTHKLYPTERACLLSNSSFEPVSKNEEVTINWKFENCSIIRTSGIEDSGINFNSLKVRQALTDLGYYK